MSYRQFQALTEHSAPGFVCKPAGRGRESERFVARITHEVRPPALPVDLAHLRQLVPVGAEQLVAFYACHDGFVLYRDTLSITAGVELFRVADMERRTESMRRWLATPDDEEEDNYLETAIAIGESPRSGNYFVMTIKGPQTGKVLFLDHEGGVDQPFADSFNQYLSLVSTSPVSLLSKRLNCIARYSDGYTNTQWIPTEYLPVVSVDQRNG